MYVTFCTNWYVSTKYAYLCVRTYQFGTYMYFLTHKLELELHLELHLEAQEQGEETATKRAN